MKNRSKKKPRSTLWDQRDHKRLPIEGVQEGQNAVLGLVSKSMFKHPKTALRGVTRKGHARAVLAARARGKRRRSALRRARRSVL